MDASGIVKKLIFNSHIDELEYILPYFEIYDIDQSSFELVKILNEMGFR